MGHNETILLYSFSNAHAGRPAVVFLKYNNMKYTDKEKTS
jgi:hypothetical protein